MSRVVLADFFVRDDGVDLFLVDAHSVVPEIVTIDIARSELTEVARVWSRAIAARRDAEATEAEARLRLLVEPIIARSEPGDVIWIVPHAVIHLVPLHAIRINGVIFGERNAVCYSPNISIMSHCRARRSSALRNFLVVGDPDLSLPGAREEAEAVAMLLHTDALVGSDARKESVVSRIAERRTIDAFHFATHAVFDPAEPMQSGVVLAGDGGDDVLTAAELMYINIDASLITVSACRTASADIGRADEIAGLSRALLLAGGRSLVLVLWDVEDFSTSLLMRAFYAALVEPQPVAAALRKAQVALRTITAAQVLRDLQARITSTEGETSRRRMALLQTEGAIASQAGAFDHALLVYRRLADELRVVPDDWATAMMRLVHSRLPLLESASKLPPRCDYDYRPYEAPYYWAAFVVIGSWD